jgi:hypothetical protein
LQFGQAAIELFTEGDPVELVPHRLVEALADPIGLRALGLGSAVIDVLDREIQFVLVPLRVAAVFAAAIGEHPAERDAALLEERQHPVIQQIGRGDCRLDVVKLGEADLGVGVDEGLLIDAAHPLQRADVEGVLGAAVAGTGAVELAVRFLVRLRLLERRQLVLGQDQAVLCHLGFQRLQPFGHGVEVVADPDTAHAGGRDPEALLSQLVGHPGMPPGRLVQGELKDAPLDSLGHPVPRVRHSARHLDQRRFATLLVEVSEPVEAVAGKPHDPAGVADAAELLRQLQHTDLVADDLLVSRHRVVSSLRYSLSTLGDDTPTIRACQI